MRADYRSVGIITPGVERISSLSESSHLTILDLPDSVVVSVGNEQGAVSCIGNIHRMAELRVCKGTVSIVFGSVPVFLNELSCKNRDRRTCSRSHFLYCAGKFFCNVYIIVFVKSQSHRIYKDSVFCCNRPLLVICTSCSKGSQLVLHVLDSLVEVSGLSCHLTRCNDFVLLARLCGDCEGLFGDCARKHAEPEYAVVH